MRYKYHINNNWLSVVVIVGFENKCYHSQYELTTSRNNYSVETPIFLDENGKINVIANIYSIAGADCYSHILNTNK